MKAIKLTKEKTDKMLTLIDYFYEDSQYGSYDNFKKETNSSIVLIANDDDFLLSESVLEDSKYAELIAFLKAGMGSEFKPVEVTINTGDLNGQF